MVTVQVKAVYGRQPKENKKIWLCLSDVTGTVKKNGDRNILQQSNNNKGTQYYIISFEFFQLYTKLKYQFLNDLI